ncbi:MAG: type II secretion system F family protein [Bacteroidota bacterium]
MAEKQSTSKDSTARNFISSMFGSNKSGGNKSSAPMRRKKTYNYRVRRGSRVVEGYQTAYSKSDVQQHLRRLGFEIVFIRRHFDIQFRAASSEIVSFVSTSARLLEQKMTYTEVLNIMVNNTKDKALKNAIRNIILDLKSGIDSKDAFMKQSKVFGEHVALMLGIASKSGEMTSIFKSVALLVERQTEFKKSLISSLVMPMVTSLTVFGAIIFYAVYLVPRMMDMLGPMMATTPPLTKMTMDFNEFLNENITWMSIVGIASIVGFYGYLLTAKGKLMRDKVLISIPYVGNIFRNTSTEIFCRVLGIMYTSSRENIEAIQVASEASGNLYLAHRIKTVSIPSMLKYGTELSRALDAAGFFPDIFISRFNTASETGAVKDTAIQVADYYQLENQFSLKNLMSVIEISITLVIMIALIFLTILSTETASINIEPTM